MPSGFQAESGPPRPDPPHKPPVRELQLVRTHGMEAEEATNCPVERICNSNLHMGTTSSIRLCSLAMWWLEGWAGAQIHVRAGLGVCDRNPPALGAASRSRNKAARAGAATLAHLPDSFKGAQ